MDSNYVCAQSALLSWYSDGSLLSLLFPSPKISLRPLFTPTERTSFSHAARMCLCLPLMLNVKMFYDMTIDTTFGSSRNPQLHRDARDGQRHYKTRVCAIIGNPEDFF